MQTKFGRPVETLPSEQGLKQKEDLKNERADRDNRSKHFHQNKD